MQIIKKFKSTSLYQDYLSPRFQCNSKNRPKGNNSTFLENKNYNKNQFQKKYSNQKINHGLRSTSNMLLQIDISKENKKTILNSNQFKTVSNSQISLNQFKPKLFNKQLKLIPTTTKYQISKKFSSSFNISNNQILHIPKKQITPINQSDRFHYLEEFKKSIYFNNGQPERKKLLSYRNENMTTKINETPMREIKQKHRHNNSAMESNFFPLSNSTSNFVLENGIKFKLLGQKNTKFINQESGDQNFHKYIKQSKTKTKQADCILKGQNLESIVMKTQTTNDFNVKLEKKLKICSNNEGDLNKYIQDLKRNLRNKEEIKIFKKKKEQPKTKSKIIQLGVNYKNNVKINKQHPANIINNSRFKYGKKLGKGRFGNVYIAKDKYTSTLLAIKQIEISSLIESEMINQLQQQIKIQSFLNHPNILKMYGYFSDKQLVYLLLQLSQGNIFRQLKLAVFKFKQKRFEQKKAAFYLRQVIEAIQYMHKEGVLHRDIKPQNILNSMGVLKLSDFGWSIYSPQKQRKTFCGTLDYVSPQIVTGKQYDFRVDVWSIGVLCYELCTGKAPFQNKNRQEQTYEKIVRTRFNFPQYLSSGVRDFINRILIRDPNKRMTIECALQHKWLLQNSKNIYKVEKYIWNQMIPIMQ